MKRYVVFLAILCFPFAALGATNDFTRTLFVGTHGEDVRALQKFLNSDAQTRVAETGAGSLGNETDYFGSATKRALIKFQEKYRNEVLIPVGLTSGTGVFGPKTREKISALLTSSQKTDATALKEIPQITTEQGKVYLMFPSQYSGKAGTMITVLGAGFTTNDNTIYFGTKHAVIKASSQSGQSITFKIPEIPKGLYNLSVKNARGESNKEQWFIVTDGVSPEPKIEKTELGTVSRGDTVVIHGSGFLKNNNTIMVSGIGLFENVSSADGTSVSFVVPQNAFPVKFSPKATKQSFSISIRVLNENGVSNMGKLNLAL
ncbi:MAG: IPT/TIG domain-containing protein [Candidatus Pacebacteria bacterium]|jgi:peptidoglycan hydrolase-like protein with peptidoglycan-binding domain|nr:IPT/TIG domain-containing protein [Candidatus Paceibacterota bacterium]